MPGRDPGISWSREIAGFGSEACDGPAMTEELQPVENVWFIPGPKIPGFQIRDPGHFPI